MPRVLCVVVKTKTDSTTTQEKWVSAAFGVLYPYQ